MGGGDESSPPANPRGFTSGGGIPSRVGISIRATKADHCCHHQAGKLNWKRERPLSLSLSLSLSLLLVPVPPPPACTSLHPHPKTANDISQDLSLWSVDWRIDVGASPRSRSRLLLKLLLPLSPALAGGGGGKSIVAVRATACLCPLINRTSNRLNSLLFTYFNCDGSATEAFVRCQPVLMINWT